MSSETVVEILYDDKFHRQIERSPTHEPTVRTRIRVDGYGVFDGAQDLASGFFLVTISDLLDLYNEPDRTCSHYLHGIMLCLHRKNEHLTVEKRANDERRRGLLAAATTTMDEFAIATIRGSDVFLEKTAALGATEMTRRDELIDAVGELRAYLIEERGISESDI